MKAIVIVFSPTPEQRLGPEQPLGGRDLDTWQLHISWQSAKADLSKTSARDEMTPPFWTWFIENPRRRGA